MFSAPYRLSSFLRCPVLAVLLAGSMPGRVEAGKAAPDLSPNPISIQPLDFKAPGGAGLVGGFTARVGGELIRLGGQRLDGEGRRWEGRVFVSSLAGAQSAPREIEANLQRADGACIVHGESIVLIGGNSPAGPTAAVTAYRVTGATLEATAWPALPAAVVSPGAALLDGRLYVVGGMSATTVAPETPLWSLDLAAPEAGWRVEASLPAPPRHRPLVVVQHGGIHVFGGHSSLEEGKSAVLSDSWVFLPKPRDASVLKGWQALPRMPHGGAAGAVWAFGQASVVMQAVGNDHARLLLFNTVTEGWAELAGNSLPASIRPVAPPESGLMVDPADETGRIFEISPQRYSRTLGFGDYAVIVFYFAAMAGIGVFFGRRQTTAAEFTLGSRKVHWAAAGVSMFATSASSISFIAIPAMAYLTNAIWLLPLAVMVVCFFIQGWLIFPLLRRMQITSTFEYLESRFNPALRLIASAQAIFFQTIGRMTVVLVLPAMALSATTGINVVYSVVIMGALTTLYTALGGFEAVIWTDVIQGAMMLLTPLVIIVLVLLNIPGSPAESWGLLQNHGKLTLALPSWDLAVPAAWILGLATLFQHTINLAGDQPVIQRVFSTPLASLRRTSATYITSGILIGLMVNAMGFAVYLYFHHHPERLLLTSSNDQVIPAFLVTALPVGVAGLIIAAVFAAAMSTVSSSMNSVATLLHQDFYKRLKPRATAAQDLRFLKATAYLIGILGTGVAAYMATLNITSMFALWSTILGLLGGGIVGVYSLGMFTRRANSAGAITGAAASIVWTILIKQYTDVHYMVYLPSAVLVCFVVGYVASWVLPGKQRDLQGLTIYTPTPDAPAAGRQESAGACADP